MTPFEHWMLYFCFCSLIAWNSFGTWISIRLLSQIRRLASLIEKTEQERVVEHRDTVCGSK